MDRTDKELLKRDKFIEEVQHSVVYLGSHRKQFLIYGLIAIAVLVAAGGYYLWSERQAEQRQADLREAMRNYEGAVGQGSNPYVKIFPTQHAKDQATIAGFNGIIAKYPNKPEGVIARYYMGVLYADKGSLTEAEKYFRQASEVGGDYSPLAKFSLALTLNKQGKVAESEKILRELVASPSMLVSKEQAEIELAKVIAPTKPDEARKILDPLRTSRNAVSRWAITTYAEAHLSDKR